MKNHNDREHAILSASGSKRWLKCPPSVRLEEVVETSTSIYALEGTFMHELSELHLHLFLDNITKVEFNKRLNEMKDNKFYTKENEKAVKIYVDAVIEKINEARARSKDPLILIEERLDYSPWVKEGFGTGDVLIITDEIIEVIDLKGGKGVKVSAVNNSQMKLYALGAINGFGMLYDIEKVIMTIVQPRLDHISTDEIDAHNLLKWAEEELPQLVKAWRKTNSDIVRFWWDIERAAIKAVKYKKIVNMQYGIKFKFTKGILFIALPSGRSLSYVRPRIEKDERFNKDKLTYESRKRGKRISTYGGKLVENIVQAVARDCLAEAMLRLDKEGYVIAFHVHDEVILDVPKDKGSLKEVNEIMSRPIKWAKGLPLSAAGFETKFYMKD